MKSLQQLWPAIKAMLGVPAKQHMQGPPPQGGSVGKPKPRVQRYEAWPPNVPDEEVVLQLMRLPPHFLTTQVKIARGFSDQSGADTNATETITVGRVDKISQAIIANQTNKAIALAWTNSKLKLFAAISDVAMTVKTNDGSSPQETLHLLAGIPYIWTLTGSYIGSAASPFGGDVTGLFVTNTTAGTLTALVGVDPT